jgi:DNA methylase/Phage integrase family
VADACTCTCTQAGHTQLPCESGPAWDLHAGDALAVLSAMPGQSADCIVTSPPYWAKRDYGMPGHYGREPSPDEYIGTLRRVFAEAHRVLRDDGTCWLNLTRVQVIVAGKVIERETAKTPAGERTLLLDGTVRALRELRRLQRKERLAAGQACQQGSHGGYVAADETGAGYSTQRLRGTFYRLVASAGLRKITFYHARHSALSYLLSSGQVPIAVVAACAGHADGGATALKHYIRVRPGDLEARDAIAALLGA